MLLIKHSVVRTQEMEVLKLKNFKVTDPSLQSWSKYFYLVFRDLNADMEQLAGCLHVCIITPRYLHEKSSLIIGHVMLSYNMLWSFVLDLPSHVEGED